MLPPNFFSFIHPWNHPKAPGSIVITIATVILCVAKPKGIPCIMPNRIACMIFPVINPTFSPKRFNKKPLKTISSDNPVRIKPYASTAGNAANPLPAKSLPAVVTPSGRKRIANNVNPIYSPVAIRIAHAVPHHFPSCSIFLIPIHLKKFCFLLANISQKIRGIKENSNTCTNAPTNSLINIPNIPRVFPLPSSIKLEYILHLKILICLIHIF